MIHTLEAVDANGNVFHFAGLVKLCCRLIRIGGPFYRLRFPDDPEDIIVSLRKRDQATATLERARAAWARIPILDDRVKTLEQVQHFALRASVLTEEAKANHAKLDRPDLFAGPPTFTDALRRPRSGLDQIEARAAWAMERYDKDAPGRVVVEGKLHENMIQMGRLDMQAELKARRAAQWAALGERINKL